VTVHVSAGTISFDKTGQFYFTCYEYRDIGDHLMFVLLNLLSVHFPCQEFLRSLESYVVNNTVNFQA